MNLLQFLRICVDIIGINTFEVEVELEVNVSVSVEAAEEVEEEGSPGFVDDGVEYVMESPGPENQVLMSAIPETTGEYHEEEVPMEEAEMFVEEEEAPGEYYGDGVEDPDYVEEEGVDEELEAEGAEEDFVEEGAEEELVEEPLKEAIEDVYGASEEIYAKE